VSEAVSPKALHVAEARCPWTCLLRASPPPSHLTSRGSSASPSSGPGLWAGSSMAPFVRTVLLLSGDWPRQMS
jgi:hypothetical protein